MINHLKCYFLYFRIVFFHSFNSKYVFLHRPENSLWIFIIACVTACWLKFGDICRLVANTYSWEIKCIKYFALKFQDPTALRDRLLHQNYRAVTDERTGSNRYQQQTTCCCLYPYASRWKRVRREENVFWRKY